MLRWCCCCDCTLLSGPWPSCRDGIIFGESGLGLSVMFAWAKTDDDEPCCAELKADEPLPDQGGKFGLVDCDIGDVDELEPE